MPPFPEEGIVRVEIKFKTGSTVEKQYRDFESLGAVISYVVSTASCPLQRMAEQINKPPGLAVELTSVNMLGKVRN